VSGKRIEIYHLEKRNLIETNLRVVDLVIELVEVKLNGGEEIGEWMLRQNSAEIKIVGSYIRDILKN
jgi:hypothetical protein